MADWVSEARSLERGGRRTLIAIGKFDGVHRGHARLLAGAASLAAERGLQAAVLTFDPHPALVLGRAAPPMLTGIAKKAALIRGVAPELAVVAQRFDRAYAALTPRQFAEDVLVGQLGARAVVVGQNFRFGKERAGTFDTLQALGGELGFDVWAEPIAGDERGRWSSTRVRASLSTGDLDDATRVLGRAYGLEGVVTRGRQVARTLGCPTANLTGVETALPAFGVYAVRVSRMDGGVARPLGGGVANIGERPTLAAGLAVEAHVLDFDGDLYGATLELELVTRLREERRFSGVDELRAQIALDVEHARRALDSAHPSE
ncbi:MAG: bifunctional riboflavin kinase/FAD synthetase [Polyangiaceae bacterium]|nr:bifunctional riboflavin kinase/FAD synthetase [Polyangiaceae bacterium]